MRTTITLEPDVYAAVTSRRRGGAGMSEIVNELIRAGLSARGGDRAPFVQSTSAMAARIDVRNIGDVLETVDGPAAP